ncbi:winged helix-turn-helix domain-containing protein [Nonomuraea ferruginea]
MRRGERDVELTPREFALLEYLLRRRDEVVSKSEILEHVWDTFDTDPNVVEVYVGYLRRKIDAPFGRNALQTVRGAGYRLAERRWLSSRPRARRPGGGGRGCGSG